MKRFKFFIYLVILLTITSPAIYASANEIANVESIDIEAEAIDFLSTFDDFIPDELLLENEDYATTYEAYTYEMMQVATEYVSGGYDLEYATEQIMQFVNERNMVLEELEQKMLEAEINRQENEAAEEQGKIDGFVDIMTMYDKDGNPIIDYTNIDFSEMPNKRTITVQGILEEGTATSGDFYVKVSVAARNLFYEPEPTILDKSNNYTAKIDVPNDKYLIYFTNSATNDLVYIEENGNIINARMNPKITFDIIGAIKIDSNANEIVMIEGNEYVEVEEDASVNINVQLIILIAIVVIVIVAIVLAILYIFKVKRQNEI